MAVIERALDQATADESRPTLIEVRTVIGYGAPHVAGTNKVHGNSLGEQVAAETKKAYGWDYSPFFVPQEVKDHFKQLAEKGRKQEDSWKKKFADYEKSYPELAQSLKNAMDGKLPERYAEHLPVYNEGTNQATRTTSGEVINALAERVPQLFGGSADLASYAGVLVTLDRFGASAPGSRVLSELGFTPEHVVHVTKSLISDQQKKTQHAGRFL